jgi:hypothetical protein
LCPVADGNGNNHDEKLFAATNATCEAHTNNVMKQKEEPAFFC